MTRRVDDLDRHIQEEKKANPEYWEGYEERYEKYKLGVILKMARKEAKMTQEEVAKKMKTKKSAISRWENHAEDMMASKFLQFMAIVGQPIPTRYSGK